MQSNNNDESNFSIRILTMEKKILFYHYKFFLNIILYFFLLINLIFKFLIETKRNYKYLKIKQISTILILILILIAYKLCYTEKSSNDSYLQSSNFINFNVEEITIQNKPFDATTFLQYKQKYFKIYSSLTQQVFRSIIFSKNLEKINHHNLDLHRKYNMQINKFTDLTPFQFSQTYTTLYKSTQKIQNIVKHKITTQTQSNFSFQHSFDSLDQDSIKFYVEKQKNQKSKRMLLENQEFKSFSSLYFHQNEFHVHQNITKKQIEKAFELNFLDNILLSLHQLLFKFKVNFVDKLFILLSTFFNNKEPQLYSFLDSIKQKYFSTHREPLKISVNLNISSTNVSTIQGNFSSSLIDWTVHAGKVRYQGVCGACYTFATSDAIASLYSIYKYGFFIPLTTQQVIDCSTNGLTYGCNGGFLEGSLAYMQIKGIEVDFNYPYASATSGQAGTCKKDGGNFKINSFKNIQEGNCKALANQLNYGPVSIGIAGYRLQFYSDGIFNDCNSYIDHAVVLIAYKGGVGWKIKNSWGPDWGMNGFAWIIDGNNCGICNMAVSSKL